MKIIVEKTDRSGLILAFVGPFAMFALFGAFLLGLHSGQSIGRGEAERVLQAKIELLGDELATSTDLNIFFWELTSRQDQVSTGSLK
jgi:hypothetical protein